MRWQVQLLASQQELDYLSQYLCNETLGLTKDQHGRYLLSSIKFDDCKNSEEIKRVSTEILAMLNGATRLTLGQNLKISASCVIERFADGAEKLYLHLSDEINFRVFDELSVTDADGKVIAEYKPVDPIMEWLAVGLSDDSVGKILRLLGQEQNWVELYRIFEVIEHDMGGIENIVESDLSSKGQLKLFKHTANSPGAAGDDSRHGKETTRPPKDPMPISEARALIQALVFQWLRRKQST